MDISKFARKPQLVKLELDDKDIVDTYGEAITFYIIDHFDITTYFDFYKFQQEKNSELLNDLLRRLILKEDGTPAMSSDDVLPTKIVLAILYKIDEFLGKSEAQAKSTQETGQQLS